MTAIPTLPPDAIEISIPALAHHGAILRTLVSAMGADAGWCVDDIDDLKLALSEVLSMMVGRDDIARVRVAFTVHGRQVTVRFRSEPIALLGPPDVLGAAILAAVVDQVDWEDGGATLHKHSVDASA